MREKYVVTVDGREITSGDAPRAAALGAALRVVDLEGCAVEVAIAESRTLQVFACWRRVACGWQLVGSAAGWLRGGDA